MSEEEEYRFSPEERKVLPGAPFMPPHPLMRRLGYAAIGVSIGIASTFGNSLVNINLVSLAGPLGFDQVEASWLPAIYIAMVATVNLALIKARMQFGIPTAT